MVRTALMLKVNILWKVEALHLGSSLLNAYMTSVHGTDVRARKLNINFVTKGPGNAAGQWKETVYTAWAHEHVIKASQGWSHIKVLSLALRGWPRRVGPGRLCFDRSLSKLPTQQWGASICQMTVVTAGFSFAKLPRITLPWKEDRDEGTTNSSFCRWKQWNRVDLCSADKKWKKQSTAAEQVSRGDCGTGNVKKRPRFKSKNWLVFL